MKITAALIASVTGAAMLCAAVVDGGPGPEPIPLRRAAIATPVAVFATTPPIRATAAAFVSTRGQPVVVPNHKQMLMRWYLPEPEVGMRVH